MTQDNANVAQQAECRVSTSAVPGSTPGVRSTNPMTNQARWHQAFDIAASSIGIGKKAGNVAAFPS